MQIELLSPAHDLKGFDCGVDSLNVFLRSYARTRAAWDLGRTFVGVPEPGDSHVIGYYTLQTACVTCDSMEDMLGVDAIPVVLLDRLAVDREFKGQGLGGMLLVDALARAHRVSSADVAAHAVYLEALDDAARAFYLHYGFHQLDDDPHHLYITMKEIGKLGL